jgi:hypothetical protein
LRFGERRASAKPVRPCHDVSASKNRTVGDPDSASYTGTRHALSRIMANKAGYAFAWLLGIPLPILLIVYLVSRC